MKKLAPKISIVMGSQSDWSTLKHTSNILKELKIIHEKKIISAHRTPKRLYEFADQAYENEINIIIAGAGGSAHLPGMIASIDVLSGKRTVLDYFWQPIAKTKSKALRD